LGNINNNTINEIWNGEQYNDFRFKFYSAEPYECCRGCGFSQVVQVKDFLAELQVLCPWNYCNIGKSSAYLSVRGLPVADLDAADGCGVWYISVRRKTGGGGWKSRLLKKLWWKNKPEYVKTAILGHSDRTWNNCGCWAYGLHVILNATYVTVKERFFKRTTLEVSAW
jgi:hypothetical protein